ncbi:HB2L protein, partial [Tricholaema leucomelas]|nr:HB2L protein [Tricholaema leucomelas]
LAPALPGVFLFMFKAECQFLNGTERVRYLARGIYNREQYVHFDSDLGVYVADTPLGEYQAQYLNNLPGELEQKRAAVDTYCRHNYRIATPFTVER